MVVTLHMKQSAMGPYCRQYHKHAFGKTRSVSMVVEMQGSAPFILVEDCDTILHGQPKRVT
jgi:hypothetical protein